MANRGMNTTRNAKDGVAAALGACAMEKSL